MVNLTALERITRFIQNDRNIRPMKPWSARFRLDNEQNKSWYVKMLGKKIKNLLILVSGNDVTAMLKDILTQKELDDLTLPKYKESLTNLTEHYKKTEFKHRHNIMRPLKNASFRYSQVKRLGFAVSRFLWRTCTNREERNLGGGCSIPPHLQNAIRSYLKENSNIASNRMVKNKNPKDENYKEWTAVRYLVENKSELYKTFPFSNEISKTTFFKYANITNEFKRPYRITDLCDYCEKGLSLKKEIKEIVKEENYEYQEQYNILEMKDHFKTRGLEIARLLEVNAELENVELLEKSYSKIKNIIQILTDYEAILFHKNVAKCQRIAYNTYLQNTNELRNKVLIELDFKQRIVVGMSPRQVSREYYNLIDRSCLGFGIYYVDENDQIKSINFDIISNDPDQDSLSAVRGFRLLRLQNFFKQIDKKEYIVWSDCGKHFRNKHVLGYLLLELAEQKIAVNLNFFGDKHGKNGRDCHFSNVSKFVEAESLVRQINGSQDIVDAILNRQKMANQNKKDHTKDEITYAIALDVEKTKNEAKPDSDSNYQVLGPEKFVEENIVNLLNLHLKKNRINGGIRQIKNSDNIDDSELMFNYLTLSNVEEHQRIQVIRPATCRDLPGTQKKPACMNCTAICSFSMEQILHPTNSIVTNDIKKELHSHHHPMSKDVVIEGITRKRLTHEAARELADHYIFAHGHQEPIFI